jgi:hypothetical protein
MARMTCTRGDVQRHIDQDGFVTVLEPACGAGAMPLIRRSTAVQLGHRHTSTRGTDRTEFAPIAFAEVMREYGYVPYEHMHVVAVDVDATAAHMCFIQHALLGVPAAVHVGNTLTGDMREVFNTPAHILGGWSVRLWLRRRRPAARPAEVPSSATGAGTAASPLPDITPPPAPDDDVFAFALHPARQLDLFAA